MAKHNDRGKEGEKRALHYLREKGFFILEVNWRVYKLEADIIAMDKNKLVFVEVKTRTDSSRGEPELAVTKTKQRNLIKAANEYIGQKNYNGETRFDIVAILNDGNGKTSINHIEDAFYPALR